MIEVPEWVAVCFNAPLVETYREFDIHRHPGFGRLGPDLCTASDAALDLCARRVFDYDDPDAPIAEVLLDQHVACGVGNVFRSEILFECGISPFAAAHALEWDECVTLIDTAARMLRANLQPGPRVTHPEIPGGLAVYGRNGQRCMACGDTVHVKRMGEHNRLIFWCPTCQAHLAPQRDITPPGVEREMDPHPAAALFLSELPWRREAAG